MSSQLQFESCKKCWGYRRRTMGHKAVLITKPETMLCQPLRNGLETEAGFLRSNVMAVARGRCVSCYFPVSCIYGLNWWENVGYFLHFSLGPVGQYWLELFCLQTQEWWLYLKNRGYRKPYVYLNKVSMPFLAYLSQAWRRHSRTPQRFTCLPTVCFSQKCRAWVGFSEVGEERCERILRLISTDVVVSSFTKSIRAYCCFQS